MIDLSFRENPSYQQFLADLPFTLKEEGGYSDDRHDPGGKTMEGIIQREYDKFRIKNGLSTQWVKLISDDEMHSIYFNEYWLPHCSGIPKGLNLSFFDQCVNEGPHEATILLQRSLHISQDGQWGNETQKAVDSITDIKQAILNYSTCRAAFYRSLRNFQYFGKDWLARTARIQSASIKMAGI